MISTLELTPLPCSPQRIIYLKRKTGGGGGGGAIAGIERITVTIYDPKLLKNAFPLFHTIQGNPSQSIAHNPRNLIRMI